MSRRWSALPIAALAAAAAWIAAAQTPSAPAGSPAIATVGTLRITREDFDRRASVARAEFTRRRGEALSGEFQAMLDRQILESLIRANLLVLEARRTGVHVAAADAEEQLKHDPFFNRGGSFDPARFQAIKSGDPAGFRAAVEKTAGEMAGRKLAERLQNRFTPEEARLRAIAERALTSASIDYLLLPRYAFSGDFPEPRESEVLASYRAHAETWRRPARASLSFVRVEGGTPAESRRQADSALTAIRAGGSFDEAGEALGGSERGVIVLPGNFPGYWRGDAKAAAEIFRAAPGTILSAPVPAERGWLLVRVDENKPAQVAPIAEVADDLRNQLRADRRLHFEEREVRAVYERERDRLRGPAVKVRYAVADTGALDPGRPTSADLDRFYRAHLADYTSYDPNTAAIVSRPYAEVREEVERRWSAERRELLAKSLAERWSRTWSAGARDKALERQATLFREVGPVPVGGVVDTGLAGTALSDTLRSRGAASGVDVVPYARGWIVYHVYDRVNDYLPRFEEIEPALLQSYREHRAQEDERRAYAMFEKDPKRFAMGKVLHYSRLVIEPLDALQISLTRAEIERYHRDHLDKYSAPERIRARHILISPVGSGAEADAAARKKAEGLLARIRGGEELASLARRYSDDPPTREQGGDLGWFSRGAMLEPFERVAFAMKPGEVSDLVKTEVGYHIIQVIDYAPMSAEPLEYIYTNVGADAAQEKALRIANRLADSLLRVVRTPAQARAAGRRLGLEVNVYLHEFGNTNYPPQLRDVMVAMEKVPMGKIYPSVVALRNAGFALFWADSVTEGGTPDWPRARVRVLEAYAREAGLRSLEAKRAELDSLSAAGWSLDSLGALWGGLHTATGHKPGGKLRELGVSPAIDSLVFGGRRAGTLAPGGVSDWLDLPLGVTRVRLHALDRPSASMLAARMESERRLALERSLFTYYEDLKKRYAVRILDARLREVVVPPPPPEASLF